MALPRLPAPRSLFRMAVLALFSSLWLASCAPDSSEAFSQDLSSLLTASSKPPRTLLVHIYYRTEEDLSRLSGEVDLLEHADRAAGYVDALVGEKTFELLESQGFAVVIDEEQTALLDQAASMSTMSIPGYACYRTVEETSASMAQLEATYSGLVRLVDAGDSYVKAASGGSLGYDMQVLVATNEAIPGPKPRFFLMGAIHAREYATGETVMRFAEEMLNGYGTDPDATWLLDNYELHVLPHSNPDGRKVAERGYTQRKNRHYEGACADPPTDDSQIGVDLNRNSSWKWGGEGSSASKCNLTYRGASAASEPETAAMQSYMASIFPDQRGPGDSDPAPPNTTGVMITVHSYGAQVLYPWGYPASAPNATELATLGRKFGYLNYYDVCQGPDCTYSTTGTTDDWAYGELGIASYTFEIGTEFFQPCSSFIQTVLPNNLKALRAAFKYARLPYQSPKGPDALNVAVSPTPVRPGTVVTLTATVDDTRYNSNGWGTDEPTQNIAAARYSVDQPSWANGATTFPMGPSDGVLNAKIEGMTASVNTAGWAPGRHLIYVEGRDANGNWGAPTGVFLDVLWTGRGPL